MKCSFKLYFFSCILFCVFLSESNLLYDPISSLRYFFASVGVFLGLIYILKKDKKIFVHKQIMILFLIFILIQLISFVFAENRAIIYHEINKSFLFLSGIFVLSNLYEKDQRFKLLLFKSIILICLAWNCFGAYDFIVYSKNWRLPASDSYLVASLFSNKNFYAAALMLCTPIICISYLKLSGIWKKLSVSVFLLNVIMIVILQTRSVWLASAAMFFTFLVLIYYHTRYNDSIKNTVLKRCKIGLICSFILIFSFGFYQIIAIANKQVDQKSIVTIEKKQSRLEITSVEERIFLWKKTISMICDNPFLGVGSGNWKTQINKYGLTGSTGRGGNTVYKHCHNDFLNVLAENGIIGFLIFIGFFFLLIRLLYNELKSKDNFFESLFVFIGIIGFLIYSFFEFPGDRPEHIFLLIIYVSILISYQKKTLVDHLFRPFYKKSFVFIVSFLCLLYNFEYIKSEYYFLKINRSRLSEDWVNCIKYSEKINRNIFCCDFICVPLNWYSGIAYYSVGNYLQAKTEFEKAFHFFPFNLHVLNNLGSTYVMLKDNSSAEKKYREALHVSNDFDDARINLAILLYNQGKRSECISELKKISNPIIFSNYLDFVIDVVDPDKIKNIKDADTALKELLYL